ncbi:hypothetical protein K439DRAFT_59082 [Ramaria rubella]|nr:hypothetical protein K439DRAFT_59082 [Ramaria rubella]
MYRHADDVQQQQEAIVESNIRFKRFMEQCASNGNYIAFSILSNALEDPRSGAMQMDPRPQHHPKLLLPRLASDVLPNPSRQPTARHGIGLRARIRQLLLALQCHSIYDILRVLSLRRAG